MLHNLLIIPFAILFTILFYFCLYFFRNKWTWFRTQSNSLQIQYVSRVISSLHAVIATLTAAYVLITDKDFQENKLIYRSNALITNYSIIIGYLLFDFIMMIIYKKEIFDWQFVIHHLVSSIAGLTSTNYGVFAYIAAMRTISEASTLFVNIRWFLLSMDMKQSKLYLINGLVAYIVFGLVRIVTLIPIWKSFYEFTSYPQWSSIHIAFKLICVLTSIPLDCLNIYWYYRMTTILFKTFSSSKKAK